MMKPHVNVNHIINLDGDVKSKINKVADVFRHLLAAEYLDHYCMHFVFINKHKTVSKEEETKMISRQVAQATLKIQG